MAGDWIKWAKGLTKKREVLVMAAALGRSRHEVASYCMEWWEWCDDNVPDDRVSHATGGAVVTLTPTAADNAAFIDSIVGLEGFANALAAAGWLRFRSGAFELPNFARHNGATAKARARNGVNQRRRRKTLAASQPGLSPPHGDKTVTEDEPAAAAAAKEKKPRKPRPRNPLFDVLAEVTGLDPQTAGGKLGKASAVLADAGYGVEDVRRFIAEMPARFVWHEGNVTPSFIEQNIGVIRTPLTGATNGSGHGSSLGPNPSRVHAAPGKYDRLPVIRARSDDFAIADATAPAPVEPSAGAAPDRRTAAPGDPPPGTL